MHSGTFQNTKEGALYREKSCAYPGLAEPNEPNPLSSNDQHDKPEEDPSHDGMSIKSVLLTHISEAKPIKL